MKLIINYYYILTPSTSTIVLHWPYHSGVLVADIASKVPIRSKTFFIIIKTIFACFVNFKFDNSEYDPLRSKNSFQTKSNLTRKLLSIEHTALAGFRIQKI